MINLKNHERSQLLHLFQYIKVSVILCQKGQKIARFYLKCRNCVTTMIRNINSIKNYNILLR